MLLILIICFFLNYDLFYCDQLRKFPARSYRKQQPAQIEDQHQPEHETDVFIRKIREEIHKAQSARKAMNVNFGFGLEDYNIPPVDVFDTPKVSETVQRNLREKSHITVGHNEDFMNYDITQMFWTGTPKIGETELFTAPESFLPTPEGFQLTTEQVTSTIPTPDHWQNFENLPAMETTSATGLSVPFDLNHHPEYPDQPIDGTSSISFPPPEPSGPFFIPGDVVIPTPFTRPTFPFSVPPVSIMSFKTLTAAETREPVSPLVWTDITFPGMPNLYPNSSEPEEIDEETTTEAITRPTTIELPFEWMASTLSSPSPIPSLSLRGNTARPQAISKPRNKVWMKFRPGIDKSLINLLGINVARDSPTAQQPPEVGWTLSKAQSMNHDKQWTKVSADIKSKIMVAASTQAVFTQKSKAPDVRGSGPFFPSALPHRVENIANATTASNVVHNASTLNAQTISGPNKKYYDMMQELHESFLGIFLQEFTRILSEKEEKYIREIIMPLELILKGYEQSGIMSLFEAAENTAALKVVMKMAHQVFTDRKRFIAEDVNAVLDFVNLFYSNEQGYLLFNALRDLEMYPNGNITDMELCKNLLMALIDPIYKKASTAEGNQLKSLVIGVMSVRGGRRMSYRKLLKLPDPEPTASNHLRNYKQIYSFKQRMEMKRKVKNLMRRVFGTADVPLAQTNQPRLRSMLPITRNQKRFRVIAQRQRAVTSSANIERPTRNDHFRKSGRAIHPYNEMMQFFPQIPKEYLKHVL